MIKTSLTQVLVTTTHSSYPKDLWCKAGHTANPRITVDGVDQPMRFLNVFGDVLDKKYHGIYCENCLIIANKMAKEPKTY